MPKRKSKQVGEESTPVDQHSTPVVDPDLYNPDGTKRTPHQFSRQEKARKDTKARMEGFEDKPQRTYKTKPGRVKPVKVTPEMEEAALREQQRLAEEARLNTPVPTPLSQPLSPPPVQALQGFSPDVENDDERDKWGRSPLLREVHMGKIAKWDRRGWTHEEMADQLSQDGSGLRITSQTVKADLEVIRKRFATQILNRRGALVREKLAQLREVRREAWDAYERSKEEFKKKVDEEYVYDYGQQGGKNVQRKQHITETRLPGNEFLTTVLKCLQQERELLGLDAPKKVNIDAVSVNFDILAGELPGINKLPGGMNLLQPPQAPGALQIEHVPAGQTLVPDSIEERIKQLQGENDGMINEQARTVPRNASTSI